VNCPHCGCEIETKKGGKPRSVEQHRRLFGLVRAAFANWPEYCDFQPTNEEHLRKWLIAKAGHYDTRTFELPETNSPAMMAAMMEFAEALLEADPDEGHRFGRWMGSKLVVFIPKSIAFNKLAHKEACKLFDEIGAVIESIIGVPADKLLKEQERVA
jgi:hypothetical protein